MNRKLNCLVVRQELRASEIDIYSAKSRDYFLKNNSH